MCFEAEKMISTLPPPPKVQNQIRGLQKNDTFFIDRKEKKKKGRRERKEQKGEERGRKERKEAKKECKCVLRLKK